MLHLVKYLYDNLLVSGYISLGSIGTGIVLEAAEPRISPLIMDYFQIIAWAVGIVVGLLTIFGWVRKFIFKKKD